VLQQEDNEDYNSAAVDLANPGSSPGEKETDASAAEAPTQPGEYQPQTGAGGSAVDNAQPSKMQQATPPPPEDSSGMPANSPKNRKPLILILLGILLLALIGGGVWWYVAQSGDSEDTELQDQPVEPDPQPAPEPEPEPPGVTINSQTTKDTTPTISGRIENTDANVTVTVDGRDYNAVVDVSGSWSASVSQDLEPGTYTIHTTAVVEDKEFNNRLTDGLTIEEPEPEPQEEEEPEETPTTGPEELSNTGPSGNRPPQQR
jgi:hypothetical protein